MSTVSASLLRLKLLDALRSGDTSKIDHVLTELSLAPTTTQNHDLILIKETVLHYAVQVAPLAAITYLVNNSLKLLIDVNSQDPDGNTPLHLAVQALRADVVRYLLGLPNINDTVFNLNKQQPVDMSRDPAISQTMLFERAKFVEKASVSLRHYFQKRDFAKLEELLVHNPRAAELLDINGADPDTGSTVLHEFIRKDDYEMCEWILNHGGDPFKRDKRGKLPVDICGKNDKLKKLLKLASRNSNLMDPVINTNLAMRAGAPTYKGYLRKWTNFASGYKLRYFVLDAQGMLLYYQDQDDTGNAVRGLLNLLTAYLHLDSLEKLKFEIIGKNGIRWHLKANHPVESNRWVWTLQNAITVAKDRRRAEVSANNPRASLEVANTPTGSSPRNSEDGRSSRFFRRKHKRVTSQSLFNLSDDEGSVRSISRKLPSSPKHTITKIPEGKRLTSPTQGTFSLENLQNATSSNLTVNVPSSTDSHSVGSALDGEDYDYDLQTYDLDASDDEDTAFETTKNEASTLKSQLEVGISSLLDLFHKMDLNSLVSSENKEIYKVALVTLSTVNDQFEKFKHLTVTQNDWLERKLYRQLEVNKLWENLIHQLEEEIRKRETKLAEYEGQKKQLKRMLTTDPALAKAEKVIDDTDSEDDDEFFDADDYEEASKKDIRPPKVKIPSHIPGTPVLSDGTTPVSSAQPSTKERTGKGLSSASAESSDVSAASTKIAATAGAAGAAGKGQSTSKEDEADEKSPEKADVLPDTQVKNQDSQDAKAETKFDDLTPVQREHQKKLDEEGSYLGYENPPRKKLSMDVDNRPKVGLWGILKLMIGKDMTRMTLPVSFNEGTSLLQRLAEDIEYSDLLNTAAQYDDSTLRMVYVATFGASEYALTINRIAKPFNPLLGETFEYSRPDQKYRLLVEQVSHHPPISACRAELINWDYYGENAVDSSFRGRSFDFKHLGKMFCVVRPINGVIDKNGKKVTEELYLWKKVNTSVVGIIVGNPTVDNFGKMEVVNHTTGDVLILDLKQRGWRALLAYQLLGHVTDAAGKARWAVGGHWNLRIFAKKVDSPLDHTKSQLIDSDSDVGKKWLLDPYSGSKFLVWEAAPRPSVPFNLTQFAITLNGIDDNLRKWVAPTDTRLRPDQRAMEDGRYDEASDEKHRVEEKQRAARKERDAARVTYKPNWFTKKKHPITGDTFWELNDTYWKKRKEHQLKDAGDIF